VVLHLLLLLLPAAAVVVMALVAGLAERVRLLSKVFTAPRVVT